MNGIQEYVTLKTKKALVFGEVLFDVFDDGRRLGGAPFNFFVHLCRLGLDARFASRVGNDSDGAAVHGFMESLGLPGGLLQTDPALPTGWVSVSLDAEGVPDYVIHRDVAYDAAAFDHALEEAARGGPDLVYFGTLIQRTQNGSAVLSKILNAAPHKATRFCDLNLRRDCYNKASVNRSLEAADILKLSGEELVTVAQLLNFPETGDAAIERLRIEFSIARVCLTHGAEGSEVHAENGVFRQGPVPPPEKVRDTVGAGDAFAAVLAAGFLNGWDEPAALSRAARFAADVCGISGAVPQDPAFYEPYQRWFS